MGLVLTLKPQERIILGGAVVRNNGAYSTELMIETHTPILRCPESCRNRRTNSPCSRIYLAIQLYTSSRNGGKRPCNCTPSR